VKVNVDPAGNVVDTSLASAGPSRYFARVAQEAARDWKFAPAQASSRTWNLDFEFRRSGTEVRPTQVDR
jgi:TonB family protein